MPTVLSHVYVVQTQDLTATTSMSPFKEMCFQGFISVFSQESKCLIFQYSELKQQTVVHFCLLSLKSFLCLRRLWKTFSGYRKKFLLRSRS